MAGMRPLRPHPQPLKVVVAPLRCHMLPPGLRRDPASNGWSRPQTAARCRSRDGRSQLLLLRRREEWRPLRRDQLEAMIPQTLRSLAVVPAHDATGVVFLQPNQCGRILGRLAVRDGGKQRPAPCFPLGRRMAGSSAQFGGRHVRMEVGSMCHVAAYHSALHQPDSVLLAHLPPKLRARPRVEAESVLPRMAITAEVTHSCVRWLPVSLVDRGRLAGGSVLYRPLATGNSALMGSRIGPGRRCRHRVLRRRGAHEAGPPCHRISRWERQGPLAGYRVCSLLRSLPRTRVHDHCQPQDLAALRFSLATSLCHFPHVCPPTEDDEEQCWTATRLSLSQQDG